MPDSINLYYFRDKSGKRHSVWKSDYDADPKGFAKAYPDARMEVINRKTGDRGHVAVGDVAAAGKEGFNLFTVRGYQKEHYQKPSTPSQIAQRVGNDYLSRPKNQMGKAPVQAPKNASPFVKSLYETDNAMQGADYPVDYTSPKAVQQVHQKNEQVKAEASRTAAKQNEWTRQNQPIYDNGTKGVLKTQGQLEKEIDDAAGKFVDSNMGDYISKSVLNEQNAAMKRGAAAASNSTAMSYDFAGLLSNAQSFNKETDPELMGKNLTKSVQDNIQKIFSDPRYAKQIEDEAAHLGISTDGYIQSLASHLQGKLLDELDKSELKNALPKNGLANFAQRFLSSNTIGKMIKAAVQTKSQNLIDEQAMAQTESGDNPYYKPSVAGNVAADVAGMVTDPIFHGAAGIGGKVAGKVIGSSDKLAAVMANGNVMQRLGLNVGQAVTSGGVTGFVFGSTTNAIQNVSTGEDTSLGGTLKAALHGGMSEAGSFATMGVAGVPLGMLGRSVGLKSITTTPLTKEWFKQGTKKVGLEAAKTWMEGTGMYLGGYVAGKIEGHDQPEFNIIDGTLQSLPTAIGFRIQHLLGGIGKGRMKDADGKNLSWGKSTMLKFNEFLTSDKAKSSHYLMSEDERNQIFNSDAAKEILQNGDNIVSLGRRARNTKVDYEDPYLATDMAMVKNSYDKIMADPTISWDAKAKFSATVMGVMPSSRPMSDHQTFTFEKVGGDKVGYKKYINEYSSTGELLSKISYDTADERGRILYNQAVAREDNRFWNAFSALVNVEKNDYDLQNQFFREKVKNWVYGDGNQEKLLAGMRQYNGSTYFDEYTRYVASRSKMAESTLKSTAEELGMDARDLAKAVNKSPLKRTDAEQNACVTLRKNFEKAAYPENKAHAEQSHLEGKDLAEENNLGTEQPNAPIVVTELNNLSQAEDSLQELFNSNDVFSEEYKRYQSQGLTNPQIYDALIQQSGLTQEQIEPFARYINANARVQGMQQATAEAIEQRVESMAGDWGFHGTMDEQKADGSQMLYVQDSNGRTLIVGSGDVAYDPTTGKAKEGVGDMLVCFDPNTREMAYVKTEETTLFQTQNVEDFKNDERTRLQQINSEPYNQAAAQQAAKDAAKPQPKEGMSSSNSSDMHLAEHPKGGSDLLPTPETDIPTAGKDTNNSSNGNENNTTLTFADGSPVPMVKDSKGRPTPDYANMKPEQAAEVLTQQFGENAEKVVDGQIKKAEKAVKDAEKMKVDYTAEPNDILEQEQKKKVIADAANKQLEHAQAIKKAMTQKKVAETMAKPEGEAVEGANQASSAVAEKFSNAPRLVGNKRTRTLPNSEKIKGHYEIVPAESLTPSHDAMNGYKKSEGFPVDENGRTINDRDYENDKAAQQTTDQMALKYNGQAIDQVPVVSDEGIVYDGNGRTMAGQKAAKDGTDGEYISDLLDNAENFGFTREQIENSGIEHPRLVLVTDERMPYDTATFAKFNRNEKKAQSNTELAVAKSKTLTSDEIGSIVADIEGNGSLEAFFNNPKAISDLVKTLQNKGIIGQNEVAGLMEGEYLNPQGKELVKNILLGAAFKPETIRMMGIDSAIKTKVVSGIRAVLDNMKLGDYALRDEIDQSIQLLYEARTNKMKVDDLLRSSDFVNGNARDRYSMISQALAQALENKATLFRDLMREYNEVAKSYNTNEGSLSFYEHLSKDELLREFVEKSNIINDNNIKLYGEEGLKRSDVSSGNEEHSEEAGGRVGEEGHSAEVEAVKSIFKKYGEELTLSKDDITTLADYISNNYKGVKYAFDSWQSENESRINDPNDPNFVRERSAVRQKEKEFESAVESMLNDMQDGLLGSVRNNAIEAIKIALRQGEVKKIEEKSEPITVTVHGNEHHFSSEEVDVAKKILSEYPEKPISKMQREMMIGYDTAKALAKELGWQEKPTFMPKTPESSNPIEKAAEDYKKEHPLTDEEVSNTTVFDDLPEDQKQYCIDAALDYLHGEDTSAISEAYYRNIYEKRGARKPESTEPVKADESSADPMEGLKKAASEYSEPKAEAKPAPKAEKKPQTRKEIEAERDAADDAFESFMKELQKKRRGQLNSGFIDQNLIEAAPTMFSLAAKCAYTRIKLGMYDAKEVIKDLKNRFKEAFEGFDKKDVDLFYSQIMGQKWKDGDQRMSLSDWAEHYRKLSPEHQDKLVGDSKTAEERKQREESFISNLKMIMGGRKIDGIRELRQLAKELGLEGVKDTDLQELAETAVVSRARDIANSKAMSPERKFAEIKKLYANQPSLNMRDSDRIRHQQYSTPAPYAYLADMYVNGNGSKEIESALEPSAGNGMLTIGLPMDKVHVNDIDEARLMNLHRQGFKTITSQDGTQPFADKDVDVVVTNPPFGSATPKDYDGYKISSLEGQMAINALDSMKDDGRAAIIIGGKTEYAKNGSLNPKDKAFLGYLYSHYNVEDVINVDGSLYAKQGTTYPTRIILINGRRLDENSFPPVKDKARAETVKDYDELYKRIKDDILDKQVREDTHNGVQRQEGGEGNRPSPHTNDGTLNNEGVRAVRNGGSTEKSNVVSGGHGADNTGITSLEGRGGANDVTGGGHSAGNNVDKLGGVDKTCSRRPNGGNDGGQPTSGVRGGNEPERVAVQQRATRKGLKTEKVRYVSKSHAPFSLNAVMPADQAEAVQKNLDKLGDIAQLLVDELGYNDKDDLYQYLSSEQIDSVALAINQMKQGNAFIIGDQTGIGKGRQGAALIRYAKKAGGVPVYLTQDAALLSTVYRDMVDIGSKDMVPFVIASNQKEGSITDPKTGEVVYKLPSSAEQKRVFDYIKKYGKLPKEYDYILTTYSQFSQGTTDYEDGKRKPLKLKKGQSADTSAKRKGQERRDAVEALMDNGYVIMDECHNASGNSGVGRYFQHLVRKAKGVTFISATYAKRPDSMPIYALRTAMSKAGVESSELIDAIQRGGTTLQEIMSRTLAESGQMVRRERDMTGVTIDYVPMDEEGTVEEQKAKYDGIIGIFNDIIDFQRTFVDSYLEKINEDLASSQGTITNKKGTKDLGIKNTPFASKAFNTVRQLLLSIKAPQAVKRAIECLEYVDEQSGVKGIKPVIFVENTMESNYVKEFEANVDMEAPDFGTVLKKGLEGVLRYTETDAKGNATNGYLNLSDLGEGAEERYNAIMQNIGSINSGMFISPIDYIKHELESRGYRVGELTGREFEFIFNDDGTVRMQARVSPNKKEIARKFNNGEIDVVIANKSGATGIDLHAGSKFEDRRPRRELILQNQLDINGEVQAHGRVDRTNQEHRGQYEYILSMIPAEQRLFMMLKSKLKSLYANTTSSQKSKFNDMEVADIINKYGDKVVADYLSENLDIYSRLSDPLGWEKEFGDDLSSVGQDKLTAQKDGGASRVLQRMSLLKVSEQEKVIKEISDLYANEINRLNEMGENDLEITELPLKAKTVGKEVWKEGSEPNGDNAFADNTYIEKVNMAILKKPMKAEEVKKAQDGLTGGRSWDEYRNEKRASLKQYFDEKIASETERLEQRAQKIAQKAADKYKKEAKKNQEQNQFTDEKIEKNAQFQYDNIYKQEKEKAATAIKNIKTKQEAFERVLDTFNTEDAYVLPSDMNNPNEMSAFGNSYGRLIDIKITDNYSPTASTVSFATLDGRRKITFPVSGKVGSGDSRTDVISTIFRLTKQAEGMSDKQLHVLNMDVNNWDKLVSNESRKDGYIITGNLMQALIDTKSQGLGGQLIKYTTDTGEVKTGILMPDRFKPTDASTDAPISAKADDFIQGKVDDLTSKDGDVKLTSVSTWRGTTIELRVPSAKRGGKYFLDDKLCSFVDGNDFSTKGNSMTATISSYENVRSVLKRLSELGVRVNEERKGGTHFRTDSATPSTPSTPSSIVADNVAKVSEKVGSKVNMVNSPEEVTNPAVKERLDKGENVTGWYDEKTGEVHLYMPNIHDTYTAEKTIWHETVGHKAMRGLIGDENYSTFLRNVWYDLDKPENARLKELVDEELKYNPLNYENAVEEGIARLVEDGKGEVGFWNNIRNKVADIFRSIGYHIAPNTKDVKYLLWLSKNLQKNPNNPYWKMKAEAVRYKLEHDNTPTMTDGEGMFFGDGKNRDFESMTKAEYSEATDGQIHFRTTPSQGTAIDRYHKALNEHGYMFTESYMDNMLSLQKLMKAIRPDVKNVADISSSENPYILQNTMQGAMSNAAQMFERNVMKPLDKAMALSLDAFCGKNDNEKIRNFNLYMIMKHGLERNRVFFVRDHINKLKRKEETKQDADNLQNEWNAEKKDLGDKLRNGSIRLDEYYNQMDEWIRNNVDPEFDADKKDYSGFTALYDMKDSGVSNDAEVIASVMDSEASMESANKGSVKDFWDKVNAATKYSLDCDYNNGLVTKENHDNVSAMFDWYVPLRKFDEITAEDVYGYVTEKGDPKSFIGPTLMKAKGRKSLSETNILAQIGAMGNSAINRGGKNAIKQAFARFIRNNGGQGLVTETNIWAEKEGTYVNGEPIWKEVYPQIPEDATPDEISRIVSDFESDMQKKKATGDAINISQRGNIGFKFERAKDRSQHIVDVMIAGKKHSFVINGNPRAAQALNGLLENSSAKGVMKPLSTISRFMAQLCTSYNPEFVMRNILRDTEFASSNVTAKEGARYGGIWSKYYAKLGLAGVKSINLKDLSGSTGLGLYAKYRNGTLDTTDKIQRYFKEFMDNGGETGWVQIKNMKEWEKQYKSDIKGERSKIAKSGKMLQKFFFGNLENINEVAENMARFTTYCASRDYGRTVVRSTYDAKEVSTNFNRHGSGDAIKSFKNGEMSGLKSAERWAYGFSSSYLRHCSMFFNAGIQSTNLLAKNVKTAPKGTLTAMMATPFALGALTALLNNALIASEDEKDRKGVKDPYGELPDYIRRNNLCIYKGNGEFFTIPLAIELRAFYGLGDLAAGMTFSPNVSGQKNAAFDAVGCLSQLVPVMDYLGNSSAGKEPFAETMKGFAPSALSPFIEWGFNSDWKGSSIERRGDFYDNSPAWQRAYNGTPEFLKSINKTANAYTNDVAKGNPDMMGNKFVDFVTNPSMINHFFGGIGGGAATFTERLVGYGKNKWNDKETETKDIPFARSLFYTPSEQTSMQRTKSKWYNYLDEMETTMANVQKLRSKNVPLDKRLSNLHDLYQFENSKDAEKVNVIESAKREMKKWKDMLKKSDDNESIKFANQNIDLIMQRAVEELDKLN